jgi:succinate-semialdehyde dehydrogenase/glutarate-semialdehyde dehydrogenase
MTEYAHPLEMLIAGQWRAGRSGLTHPVIDPSTEEVIGQLKLASKQDLDDALAAAQSGFEVWRRTPAVQRAQVLERAAQLMMERAELIGNLMSREQGKIAADGANEVRTSADIVKWFAEEGRRNYGRIVPGTVPNSRQLVMKVPVGPVAAFSPWNIPVRIPARTMAAALAAGCSMVFKPAEETPACTLELARCFHDAGLPPGVLNVVYGVPHEVSEHLIASPVTRAVSFTGSIPVGRQLLKLAADGIKKVVMELGGHAPVIICDDADLAKVVPALGNFKFRNCGQACISPTRFYVQRGVYDRFVDAFVAYASGLKIGAGTEPGVQVSPLANLRRIDATHALVQDAITHGARLRLGGERLPRKGFFYAPTILQDVPESARVMNEEPFGPIAPVAAFDTVEEAIQRANRLDVGLAAYAFTGSDRRALQLSEELEAGMIGINSIQVSSAEVPFGGVKQSGIGSENGIEGMHAYLVTKFVQQAVS